MAETQNSLLIVVATYNEIDNLPRLVSELHQLLPEATILVIDDNSPDGTGDWCRRQMGINEKLQLINREGKLGLGSAAVEGFRYALQQDYSLIATLDADFSHALSSLQEMVRLMERPDHVDVGLMIGSRYVRGGGIDGWPLFRKLTSRMVNLFARTLLGIPTLDNSGAFRVYRRSTLIEAKAKQIESSGYAYLEEIVWRIHHAGIKMVEHPITFRDRTAGRSKTNWKIGVSVFWQIFKMAFRRP